MKKLLWLLLATVCWGQAQSTQNSPYGYGGADPAHTARRFGSSVTPNLDLNLPSFGQPNWDQPLNANFSALDSFLSGGSPLPALRLTGYQDMLETAAPSNPGAGYERWYASSVTHQLSCLTS